MMSAVTLVGLGVRPFWCFPSNGLEKYGTAMSLRSAFVITTTRAGVFWLLLALNQRRNDHPFRHHYNQG